MAKFKIGGELQSLGHSDITPRLEHHHGDWTTGKSVSNNQFSNYVKTDLLIGDGLNHSNRNNIKEGDHECKDEPLNGELSLPDFNRDDTEHEHAQKDDCIPPFRDLGIVRHQTGMDIRLLVHSSARLSPDLLAEVEEGMRKGRGDGSERKSV